MSSRQPQWPPSRSSSRAAIPLGGRVRASGNKNGALPILAACLLTDEPVMLTNVPRIDDVESMIGLLHGRRRRGRLDGAERGSRARRRDHVVRGRRTTLADRIRASFLLAGPLLARLGRASVPPPGGDVIGRRRLDPHLHAFERLGAEIEVNERYEMRTDGLRGSQIFLDEASVMATENTVMAAALAPGETTIVNAACEPHVQDLCHFLVSLGARIGGIGSNVLHDRGRRPPARRRATASGPSTSRSASFIGLAAVTGADITIEDAAPDDLVSIIPAFERLGVRVELGDDWVRVPPNQELAIRRRHRRLHRRRSRTARGRRSRPTSPRSRVAVATQARGDILIHEKMFENRLVFVDKLVSMGARIISATRTASS